MNDLIAALTKAGAPILGTIVGGPVGTLAGAAIGALAEALGTPATPEAVKEAIETRTDAAAIVKQVEADRGPGYLDEMNALLKDRQDARAMHIVEVQTGGWAANMPALLAIFVTVLFAVTLFVLMFRGVPESQLAFLMIGAVISEFRGSLAFFFGTTAGSIRSGDAVRSIAQQATTPTAGQVAGKVIDAAVKTAAKR